MTQFKITYATMSGDQMEDLHRELDAAIASVKGSFGRSYPLVIGGREVRAASDEHDVFAGLGQPAAEVPAYAAAAENRDAHGLSGNLEPVPNAEQT